MNVVASSLKCNHSYITMLDSSLKHHDPHIELTHLGCTSTSHKKPKSFNDDEHLPLPLTKDLHIIFKIGINPLHQNDASRPPSNIILVDQNEDHVEEIHT
ncbi:hypothetical protein Fmac_021635 [Flemingia macrophylla]|uniref:Uncharacterized protein n=1 Tax=Flemingia macrophylla TaxID=520843 RepID=A0ABD1LXH9_9FABA